MKSTGSYYTPQKLSDYLIELINDFFNGRKIKILEPSCGDGIFIDSLFKKSKFSSSIIDIVDINKNELEKAAKKLENDTTIKYRKHNTDFLSYDCETKYYDLIIGNPPYIRRSHLSSDQIHYCSVIQKNKCNIDTSIKNIWPSFLLKCDSLLNDSGVIAFVLPQDFLQVKYAKPIRSYFETNYDRIEIRSLNFLYHGIEQGVILFLAFKKHPQKGVFFNEIHSFKDIYSKVNLKKNIISDNWNHFKLSDEENVLLQKYYNSINKLSFYCKTTPGIVTAANNYFIIKRSDVEKYNLQNFVMPIIQKSSYINGKLIFDNSDFLNIERDELNCYLLNLKNEDINRLSSKQLEYFLLGQNSDIPSRYKCLQRDFWYEVEGITTSNIFFFKRSHKYPKLIKNESKILVTDTAYKINCIHEKFNSEDSIIFSFYNSLTLVFAELFGRTYGGGVLELTPSELKKLPLPYVNITSKDFKSFSVNFQLKNDISDILKMNDEKILYEYYNITKKDIKQIQIIRKKLQTNRLVRTNEFTEDSFN